MYLFKKPCLIVERIHVPSLRYTLNNITGGQEIGRDNSRSCSKILTMGKRRRASADIYLKIFK